MLGKKLAGSKILTKRALRKNNIPAPKLYAKFREPNDIFDFNWNKLPDSFALKPSKGLGGEGIIVVKKKTKDGKGWITVKRDKVSIDDLKLHCLDILEGAYSIDNSPDVAFIEEYIGRHKSLRKYAYRGTPDIRVIVFNKVPVMAMLRLPTKESGGRANLFQGAIAVGVDIATGITQYAYWHGEYIEFKPDTKRKLLGVKVPMWDEILKVAVECQIASELGYLGVDIVLHPEKGPMVLEINSQPGLKIQLANKAGLKRRLERVDELDVLNSDHGIQIAKSLFASKLLDRKKARKDLKTIKASEEIMIKNNKGKKITVLAKIDTGAWSSSIDERLAVDLGIYTSAKVIGRKRKISALGEEERPVIAATLWVAGKRIKTELSVADRSDLTYKIIIGRIDLQGFLIDPKVVH
jgi:alpha-L-glutamate ligase-like protein